MLECSSEKGIIHKSTYRLNQVRENIWEVTLEPRVAGDVCQLQVTHKHHVEQASRVICSTRFILEKKIYP